MRVKSLLGAAVVSGMMTLSASAAFVVTKTITPGTGDLAGFDIVRFFGAFGTASPEALAGATVLQSDKVTLVTDGTGSLKFLTGQFFSPNSGPTNPDVDVYGEQSDDTGFRTGSSLADAISTGVFVHDPNFNAYSVQGLFVNDVSKTTTANKSSPTNNPSQQVFNAVNKLRVEGFVQSPAGGTGGDPAAKTANAGQTGAGALFAMGIVPHGTVVNAMGQLSPDRGNVTDFDTTPEPATFGLLSIGTIGLLARRRRNA
jgi:hypothetical protein